MMDSNTNRVNSYQPRSTNNSPFKLPPSRPPSQLSDVSTSSSVNSSPGKSPCRQCSILKRNRLAQQHLQRSSSQSPSSSPEHHHHHYHHHYHNQPKQPVEATQWRPTSASTPLHQPQAAAKTAAAPRELSRTVTATVSQTEDKSPTQFQPRQLLFDDIPITTSPSPPSPPPKAMSSAMSKAAIAIAATFITSILVIFAILTRVQPLPFIDEVFHIPQAQKYCVENNFSSVRIFADFSQYFFNCF